MKGQISRHSGQVGQHAVKRTSTSALTIGLPASSTAQSLCDRFGRLPVPRKQKTGWS